MSLNLSQSPPTHNPPADIFYLSMPDVQKRTRFGKSYLYQSILDGVFPPGISIGLRSTRWLMVEVTLIQRAWALGASQSELRTLVQAMVAAR